MSTKNGQPRQANTNGEGRQSRRPSKKNKSRNVVRTQDPVVAVLEKCCCVFKSMLEFCTLALSEAEARYVSLKKEESPLPRKHYLGFCVRLWVLKIPTPPQANDAFDCFLPKGAFKVYVKLSDLVKEIRDLVGKLHLVAKKNEILEKKLKGKSLKISPDNVDASITSNPRQDRKNFLNVFGKNLQKAIAYEDISRILFLVWFHDDLSPMASNYKSPFSISSNSQTKSSPKKDDSEERKDNEKPANDGGGPSNLNSQTKSSPKKDDSEERKDNEKPANDGGGPSNLNSQTESSSNEDGSEERKDNEKPATINRIERFNQRYPLQCSNNPATETQPPAVNAST